MNTESIGKAAGIIWNQLNTNGCMTSKQIKYNTCLTDDVLYASIGWLAREGKLMIAGDSYSLI